MRARAQDVAAGETPSKRALEIEKAHAQRNHIEKIDWGGALSGESHHIQEAFLEYYQVLFAKQEVDVSAFKEKFLGALPRLDDEQKERLELSITASGVEHAIENLNLGKSPGPDG